ncbi:MAG TPA: bifunctional diaminohydroxyphosphoribosylaminopyrimidine deaminase/5-amino-6-(5-phosphoribosylamino)uracil reductase RibD [Burkholderiaceae bacterium]|nr:bifunctional diaminohydroxyphosphoribosylaminopyrimidine deaminase/5-amino-6-(5-phosphoribosylamino)uracil reductase RibD [Burkholderiaceae bacterium]
MPIDEHDLRQLRRALELAHTAIGRSDPNPRVGCVLADAAGQRVGEGATQRAGEAHAEVMALRAAQAAGASLRAGTAWVSLEPCSHHGRTPPCTDALIAAGVSRVVVATTDPNPLVAGDGMRRLRAAGVAVDLASGQVTRDARELNIGFFSRMQRGTPWVRCKVAASLDGRTALDNGRSQWITGEASRTDGHAWRRRAAAIASGAGTIVADNPRLDVRLVATEVQPLRVVIDSGLRAPPHSRVFDPPGAALVYCARAEPDAAASLRQRHVEVVELPGADGTVDLGAALKDLGTRGVNELHVEAGARLTGALLGADLVDELLVYLAPKLIGPGRGMIQVAPLDELAQAWPLRFEAAQVLGGDVRIVARRPHALRWLDGQPTPG